MGPYQSRMQIHENRRLIIETHRPLWEIYTLNHWNACPYEKYIQGHLEITETHRPDEEYIQKNFPRFGVSVVSYILDRTCD
jgi:hypothetical protein